MAGTTSVLCRVAALGSGFWKRSLGTDHVRKHENQREAQKRGASIEFQVAGAPPIQFGHHYACLQAHDSGENERSRSAAL